MNYLTILSLLCVSCLQATMQDDLIILKEFRYSLATSGVYVPRTEGALINSVINKVEKILNTDNPTKDEWNYVETIAFELTSEPAYRDASPRSRWNSYATAEIVRVLLTYKKNALLSRLVAAHPHVQDYIDTYLL